MTWDAGQYNGWEYIKKLGEGGQGEVFLARSPEARKRLDGAVSEVVASAKAIVAIYEGAPESQGKRLAEALRVYTEVAEIGPHGALKRFKTPDDPAEAEKARKRLAAEVETLESVKHPNLLKRLDSGDGWMVTEYHERGALSADVETLYAGDVLGALTALRPVVEGVACLHAKGIVHRDIKPDNIFRALDSRLVLGDFGIVFLQRGTTRVTDRMEKVGTTDWMPGWAMGMRPEDVSPKFDVYALGKVLYCMVAGRPKLQLWYHDEGANRLGELYPDRREVYLIQRILDETVRERERDCLPADAAQFLQRIDRAIFTLNAGGEVLTKSVRRRCRVCGLGHYVRALPGDKDRVLACVEPELLQGGYASHINLYMPRYGAALYATPFACEFCGHIEFFRMTGNEAAWR